MVSAIPGQLCKTDQVLPARPTVLHPSASPSTFWSTEPKPFIQKGLRAWDLMSDARTSLSLFPRDPQPVSQLGTNPQRRSGHRMVVRPCDRPNIHTPLCRPFARVRSFRYSSRRLPSHPTLRRMFTLDAAPLPSDWWLPLACLPRTLPPFPLPLQLIRVHS